VLDSYLGRSPAQAERLQLIRLQNKVVASVTTEAQGELADGGPALHEVVATGAFVHLAGSAL
jgi:hypothetical protein